MANKIKQYTSVHRCPSLLPPSGCRSIYPRYDTHTPGATGVGSLAIDVPAGGDPIITYTPIVVEVVTSRHHQQPTLRRKSRKAIE